MASWSFFSKTSRGGSSVKYWATRMPPYLTPAGRHASELARAQDHSHGKLLARLRLVPFQPPQIEFHLPFVRGFKLPDLQFDGDQAAELR